MGLKSASTVVGALSARSAHLRAMTSECASICEHGRQRARRAVGLKSASTVVALSARSAVGLRSASTVVYALSARSAVAWNPAWSSSMQGVRRANLPRSVRLSRRTAVIKHPLTTIIFTTRTCREAWKEKNFLELVRSLINDNRGDALRAASSLTSNSIHHRTHLSVRRVSPNNP